jgi:hypothetical protein
MILFLKRCLFMALLAMTINVSAKSIPQYSSLQPPEYLSVPDFKKCLGTKNMGTWKSWCLPKEMSASCPADSWDKLNKIQKRQPMPDCSN